MPRWHGGGPWGGDRRPMDAPRFQDMSVGHDRSRRSAGGAAMTFFTPDRRHVADAPRRAVTTDDAALAREARFSRWDGSQAVPDLTADEIVDALADDLVEEGDLGEALRRLIERGWRAGDPSRHDLPGLQDLLERLRRRREELLESHRLGDPLADVRAELESIVAEERDGVERRMEDGSRPEPPAKPGDADAGAGARDEAAAERADAEPPAPDDHPADDPQLRR